MNRKGFTLIELLVVIAIIGVIATFAVVNLPTSREKARMASATSFGRSLMNARGAEAIGLWPLDEGTGTTIYNRSGDSTMQGSITGATWITDGPNGKPALQFMAVGQRVTLGSITLPSKVTVAAWIRTTSTATMYPFFSNRGNGLYFGVSSGRLFTYYNTAAPVSMYSANVKLNDGKWHFVAWTSDGTVSTMYIDGKKDSSIAQTRVPETGTGYIGYDPANNQSFFGSVSELGVYTDLLTASDIQRMYTQGALRYLAWEK